MQLSLSWEEIAIRVVLAFVAGALIGFNRTERGRTAGLRTTILVCLAACIAMVQANLLLGTAGKRPDSFIVLDLMRLPLGILSGMGFIGAGAILRKGNLLLGVTTAATLWFVTVIGLCFGGGQLKLGAAGTALGLFVLWVLHRVEESLPADRESMLALTVAAGGPSEEEIRERLASEDCRIISTARRYGENMQRRELHFQVRWRTRGVNTRPPRFVEELARRPGVMELNWKA